MEDDAVAPLQSVVVETIQQNDQLPEPLAVLKFNASDDAAEECTYYILGTAHVSRSSCDDAARLIQTVKPDLVFIELCPERQPLLQLKKIKEPTLSEVMSDIRSGRSTPFQGIYSWLLARVGKDLDVPPGEEFRVAVREAAAIDACVVLGDRPLNITLARLWAALSAWEKCRLLGTLLWTGLSMLDKDAMRQEIEEMKNTDVLTAAILEVGKTFPSLLAPLITERDQFMVHIMQRLAGQATTVVAIVGAGHLQGIREQWSEEIDVEAICRMPAKPKRRVRTGLVVAMAATGMVVAFGAVRWGRR